MATSHSSSSYEEQPPTGRPITVYNDVERTHAFWQAQQSRNLNDRIEAMQAFIQEERYILDHLNIPQASSQLLRAARGSLDNLLQARSPRFFNIPSRPLFGHYHHDDHDDHDDHNLPNLENLYVTQ